LRAGRAGAVEAYRAHVLPREPGAGQDAVESLGQGSDRDLGSFQHAARGLHHLVHQETPGGMEHGRVVLGAAVVEPDYD
jgi:hypothetical protein